jgi:hypothetical protein
MNLDLPVDLSGLVTLKQRLESFLQEYEEKVASARSQLHHLEALLEHYPTTSTGVGKRRRGSKNLTPEATASGKNEIISVNGVATADLTVPRRTRRKAGITPPVPKERKRKPRQASPDMLPIFSGLTLTQAVLKVMEKLRGKCIDADGMAREIFGEVSEADYPIVKDRITKNLSKGKIDGLWERVPDQLGYYTISVQDLDQSLVKELPRKTRGVRRANNPAPVIKRGGRGRGKGSALSELKMLSPYQGSSLMEAIGKVMQEHKGEFVDADRVVRSLYGELLPPDMYRIAKDRITKGLSKGKIDGMWERVPERIGYYTLSMAAVMS